MTPEEEKAFQRGSKAFARQILSICAHELRSVPGDELALQIARADTVAALRRLCDDYGDNDWEDDLSLVDVIDKHLEPYLDAEREQRLKAERLLRSLHEEFLSFIRDLAVGSLDEKGGARASSCLTKIEEFLNKLEKEEQE